MSNWTIAAEALLVLAVAAVVGVVLLHRYGGQEAQIQLGAIRTAGTLVIGTGGAVALLLSARRQRYTELALVHTDRDATERRITELYTKAADQLGSDQALTLAACESIWHRAETEPSREINVCCQTIRDSTPDLVKPAIVMDGLGASVPLLKAEAELEGDDTTPIHGGVTLRGHWDGRRMECVFKSEGDYTVLPSINPTRLRVKDGTTGAMAVIEVETLSTELEPTLFGDIFNASLVPLKDTVEIKYSQNDDTTKEVVAHLLNVPQYNGAPIEGVAFSAIKLPGRLRFTGGGWKITIDYWPPGCTSIMRLSPSTSVTLKMSRSRSCGVIDLLH